MTFGLYSSIANPPRGEHLDRCIDEVHVAEDVITLDLVSKGRVILGVGIGYQPADFRAFSVPMEDRAGRFEEGIEILRLCWTGEQFFVPWQALHARGDPDPSAPLSEVGAAAVDRRQHRRRRPPGRPNRRRLRRYAQHQPGERDASRRPLQPCTWSSPNEMRPQSTSCSRRARTRGFGPESTSVRHRARWRRGRAYVRSPIGLRHARLG